MNENMSRTEDGEDLIFAYTRAQAIADGVLVDMTQGHLGALLKEAGFQLHTAMTATAFVQAVGPIGGGALPPGQDVLGRWWDVLMVLRHAVAQNPGTDRVHFQVAVWNGRRSEAVNLWAHIGPGDDGRPVVTIMLEGED